ncbi:hypothetical protein A3Q56_00999 [Intoshia linei]|uniref:HEAT repeat-containing protein 1 n=1 Tax=Intoshia linei TaxID=1819745 RepID=A0A177BCI3_9BILA|nr:hypothetical protein A3Q56_00999 [Intoshia linei]
MKQTTALSEQFKQLRDANIKSKLTKSLKVASFLFTKSDVGEIDRQSMFALGLDGFEELIKIDKYYEKYRLDLFSSLSIINERTILSIEVNEKLSKCIDEYLLTVSCYLPLTCVHKTIEWLIYRFYVHEMNRSATFLAFLPHHQSKIFIRCMQVLNLHGDFSWLKPLSKKGYMLEREFLINRCIQSVDFYLFILSPLEKIMDIIDSYNDSLNLFNKFKGYLKTLLAITCGIVSSKSKCEEIVRISLKFVSVCLNVTLKCANYQDGKAWNNDFYKETLNSACLVISISMSYYQFDVNNTKYLVSVLSRLSKNLNQKCNTQILCVAVILKTQKLSEIVKKNILDNLQQLPNLVDVVIDLKPQYDLSNLFKYLLINSLNFGNGEKKSLDLTLKIIKTVNFNETDLHEFSQHFTNFLENSLKQDNSNVNLILTILNEKYQGIFNEIYTKGFEVVNNFVMNNLSSSDAFLNNFLTHIGDDTSHFEHDFDLSTLIYIANLMHHFNDKSKTILDSKELTDRLLEYFKIYIEKFVETCQVQNSNSIIEMEQLVDAITKFPKNKMKFNFNYYVWKFKLVEIFFNIIMDKKCWHILNENSCTVKISLLFNLLDIEIFKNGLDSKNLLKFNSIYNNIFKILSYINDNCNFLKLKCIFSKSKKNENSLIAISKMLITIVSLNRVDLVINLENYFLFALINSTNHLIELPWIQYQNLLDFYLETCSKLKLKFKHHEPLNFEIFSFKPGKYCFQIAQFFIKKIDTLSSTEMFIFSKKIVGFIVKILNNDSDKKLYIAFMKLVINFKKSNKFIEIVLNVFLRHGLMYVNESFFFDMLVYILNALPESEKNKEPLKQLTDKNSESIQNFEMLEFSLFFIMLTNNTIIMSKILEKDYKFEIFKIMKKNVMGDFSFISKVLISKNFNDKCVNYINDLIINSDCKFVCENFHWIALLLENPHFNFNQNFVFTLCKNIEKLLLNEELMSLDNFIRFIPNLIYLLSLIYKCKINVHFDMLDDLMEKFLNYMYKHCKEMINMNCPIEDFKGFNLNLLLPVLIEKCEIFKWKHLYSVWMCCLILKCEPVGLVPFDYTKFVELISKFELTFNKSIDSTRKCAHFLSYSQLSKNQHVLNACQIYLDGTELYKNVKNFDQDEKLKKSENDSYTGNVQSFIKSDESHESSFKMFNFDFMHSLIKCLENAKNLEFTQGTAWTITSCFKSFYHTFQTDSCENSKKLNSYNYGSILELMFKLLFILEKKLTVQCVNCFITILMDIHLLFNEIKHVPDILEIYLMDIYKILFISYNKKSVKVYTMLIDSFFKNQIFTVLTCNTVSRILSHVVDNGGNDFNVYILWKMSIEHEILNYNDIRANFIIIWTRFAQINSYSPVLECYCQYLNDVNSNLKLQKCRIEDVEMIVRFWSSVLSNGKFLNFFKNNQAGVSEIVDKLINLPFENKIQIYSHIDDIVSDKLYQIVDKFIEIGQECNNDNMSTSHILVSYLDYFFHCTENDNFIEKQEIYLVAFNQSRFTNMSTIFQQISDIFLKSQQKKIKLNENTNLITVLESFIEFFDSNFNQTNNIENESICQYIIRTFENTKYYNPIFIHYVTFLQTFVKITSVNFLKFLKPCSNALNVFINVAKCDEMFLHFVSLFIGTLSSNLSKFFSQNLPNILNLIYNIQSTELVDSNIFNILKNTRNEIARNCSFDDYVYLCNHFLSNETFLQKNNNFKQVLVDFQRNVLVLHRFEEFQDLLNLQDLVRRIMDQITDPDLVQEAIMLLAKICLLMPKSKFAKFFETFFKSIKFNDSNDKFFFFLFCDFLADKLGDLFNVHFISIIPTIYDILNGSENLICKNNFKYFVPIFHLVSKCCICDVGNNFIIPQVFEQLGSMFIELIRVKFINHSLSKCIASLVFSLDNITERKKIVYNLMMQTQNTSEEIKLLCLNCLSEIISMLKQNFDVIIPECRQTIVELLEDDSEIVEQKSKTLVFEMEEYVGSFEKYLK